MRSVHTFLESGKSFELHFIYERKKIKQMKKKKFQEKLAHNLAHLMYAFVIILCSIMPSQMAGLFEIILRNEDIEIGLMAYKHSM